MRKTLSKRLRTLFLSQKPSNRAFRPLFEKLEDRLALVSDVTVTAPSDVDENGQVTISGIFSNPTGAAPTATIDFGDGSMQQILNLAAGATSFSTTHTYRDDDPSGTSSDVKTITATVSDGVDSDSGTTAISVNNVAPSGAAVSATPTSPGNDSLITVTSLTLGRWMFTSSISTSAMATSKA
jgi:hypothetical protein